MAGLTLGGGYGPFIGRCGLALDNLLAAEVVLADGRIVAADGENHPELFWALREGGGNFGVVTRMQHALHKCRALSCGTLVYPAAEAATVLTGTAALAAEAPDELSVQVVLMADPSGMAVVLVMPTWCGDPAKGEARLAPYGKLGTLIAGGIEQQSDGALLAAFDAQIVNGRRTTMETCSVPPLDRASIDALVGALASAPSPGCVLVTHEFKGAASRVAPEKTAFALRRDHVLIEIIAAVTDKRKFGPRGQASAMGTAGPGGLHHSASGRLS